MNEEANGQDLIRVRPEDPANENRHDGETEAPLVGRDPDEVLPPEPFRDPDDFAPIPPPKATLADVLELLGHIAFVLLITVLIPLAVIWAIYRLYRWLPFETMALVIAGLASLWAYRLSVPRGRPPANRHGACRRARCQDAGAHPCET